MGPLHGPSTAPFCVYSQEEPKTTGHAPGARYVPLEVPFSPLAMEEEDSEPLEEIPMEPVDPMEQLMLFWDLNHEPFQEPQEMWNLHLKEMFTRKKKRNTQTRGEPVSSFSILQDSGTCCSMLQTSSFKVGEAKVS